VRAVLVGTPVGLLLMVKMLFVVLPGTHTCSSHALDNHTLL
jgi:hypothetical protein